jgi:hypothetical protein
MLFGLLWMRDRRIGIFLALAAALTTAAPATTDWDDVLHAIISAVVVGLAVATTIVFSLRASSTSQPSVAAS